VTATGPLGEPVVTRYARRGATAVIEMADVSGLGRLTGRPRPQDALGATSRGTGDVLRAALDAGCRRIVLGIGGSACTDGGAGMVQALGVRVTDAEGAEIAPGGAALGRLAGVDLSGLDPALAHAQIVVACDVNNPLTGPHGAAAVYGPQKGATPEDVRVLDVALSRWADAVAEASGVDPRDEPGAGAAGGVGFAALALLGATLRPGIGIMLELLRFDELLRGADLVVTGEGSLDLQSLHGKAPIGVARAAQRLGVPVVAVCGRCVLSPDDLAAAGISRMYALSDLEPDQVRSMRDAAVLLERVGATIAGILPVR
jgi:glycerate kinase